jgi:VanZ family protein
VWSAFAVLWTIGLLYPLPERHAGDMQWQDYLRYYVGKTLHVIAYAVFAILSGWLNVRPARRWMLMFALMVHAGVTEWLQTFVGRTGMPSDVVRNYAGITLGIAASWRSWWRED